MASTSSAHVAETMSSSDSEEDNADETDSETDSSSGESVYITDDEDSDEENDDTSTDWVEIDSPTDTLPQEIIFAPVNPPGPIDCIDQER